MNTKRHLLLLASLVLLLRVPFLHQAIGGDEPYFLAAANHALADPLHPNHTWYVFEGIDVNFQGFTHPPLNASILALLMRLCGGVREGLFHIAYIPFSLIAVFAMYGLARRFSRFPLWAAILFALVPAFAVNGNTLESDVPMVAFWMMGVAAFVYGWDVLAFVSLAVTGLLAMQAIAFTPVLLAYLWFDRARFTWRRVAIACAPLAALGGWQIFERITSGQFPLAVASGYLMDSRYQRLVVKMENTGGLLIHSAFIVLPLLLPFVLARPKNRDERFLAAWSLLFFAAACVLFYSGSARYLLPMAAPVCLLATRAPLRWIQVSAALQFALVLGLATVNYQHWGAYRAFAQSMHPAVQEHRTWVDAEWGLRYYFEAEGARPLHRDQYVPTGDIVIESDLAFPPPYPRGGRTSKTLSQIAIEPTIPLRLIGLGARSGYETAALGFLPFDVRGGVIDKVRAVTLVPHTPALSYVPMNAAGAESQLLFGFSGLENKQWRWIGPKAALLLKNPETFNTLEARIYVPDASPARAITLSVVGGPSLTVPLPGPGSHVVSLPLRGSVADPLTVTLIPDRTFSPPGDARQLGVVVNAVGLVNR